MQTMFNHFYKNTAVLQWCHLLLINDWFLNYRLFSWEQGINYMEFITGH